MGTRVFCPAHGVASVTGMEERELGGGKQLFYVLEVNHLSKVWLPVGKVAGLRVRNLISATKARELLERVKARPEAGPALKTDHAARKERADHYAEALRSGSADRYTDVLNELLFRSRTDKLSQSEQQTLDTARAYFIGEVGAALKLSPGEIEGDLSGIGV
ncbi:MAG TPA: CarD family transcriptional regulator [Kofleriaceae bacterium]|nr:CarD family transcriptional regulator [Kofleriaceae bacterium]